MRNALIGTVIAMALSALAIGSVAAAPAPGGGPEFGQRVSGMTPDHAREHGSDFGHCVSQLATTGVCHHHE